MDNTEWEPIKPSKFAESVEDIFGNALSQLKPNPEHSKPLLDFHLGDPSGENKIPIHENMKLAVQENIADPKNAGYTPSFGITEARNSLAQYYSTADKTVNPNDIILTLGSQGALNILLRAFCNAGDNFLMPSPTYPYLASISKALNVNYHLYKLDAEKEWEVDLVDLESKIDERTKFILIVNPGNPTGSVFSRKHLQDILNVAEKHKLPVVSDESFDSLHFNGVEFTPVGQITTDVPVIQIGSLASFLAPGWRLGWLIIFDKNKMLNEGVLGIKTVTQIVLHPPSFIQSALPKILETVPRDYVSGTVMTKYKSNYDALESLFKKDLSAHFNFVPAQGGVSNVVLLKADSFKDIQNETEFCKALLEEENILVSPLQAFLSKGGFRVTFVGESKDYEEFGRRLKEFCQRHSK